MSSGWIGDAEELEHYLATVHADCDEEDKFMIWVTEDGGPVSFMGVGDEIVLHGTEEYSVKGHRFNLAAGLKSTSYGIGIIVI
jgi:hypothetical protein